MASWSDPMLMQTVKGITNVQMVREDVKDPLTEDNFKFKCNFEKIKEFSFLVWI